MFSSSTCLSFLISAIVAGASPIEINSNAHSLAVAAKISGLKSGITLPDMDRTRAAALVQSAQALGKRDGINVNIPNAGVIYSVNVGIGTPPTQYSLLLDTGSSNTWVGAGKQYVKTKSSISTSDTVSVSYGSGNFSGQEYIDTISLGAKLKIKKQSIGVAKQSSGINPYDGILGIGPVDLTVGSLSDKNKLVPTITDNLYAQKTISSNSLGIFFAPYSSPDNGGELTFGGVDSSKTTSPVNYVPMTKAPIAGKYWGIDQSITYGNTAIQVLGSGIVDTGTSLLMLDSAAFAIYQTETGGVPDKATGLLKITAGQFKNLKPLDFHIGRNKYTLNANAQIWPRSLNTAIGGDQNSIYLIAADLQLSSSVLSFINGYVFLERFYSVYDTGNKRVGFATTKYTDSETN